ncbi:MAG: hypothetical protein MJK04_19215, partial [Psychrosphaera sp.]|nr:hypothetical protein [Psychrosphaera sp.]
SSPDNQVDASTDESVVVNSVQHQAQPEGKTRPKKNDLPTQTSKRCKSADPYLHQLSKLAQQRKQTIEQIALSSKTVAVSSQQKERQIQLAGIELDTFRQLTAPLPFDHYDLLPVNGKPKILKGTSKQQFIGYMSSRNYQPIAAMVASGQITENTIIGGSSILTRLLDDNPNIDLTVVEQLLQAGLTANFSDLVVMTQKQAPLALVDLLTRYNKDPVSQSWYHHYRQNTLSMLAAQGLNTALFDYWLAIDVPLMTGEFDYTAVDVLPVPANKQQLQSAIHIFGEIANRQILPYKVDTLDIIKRWLPQDIQQQYAGYFEAHEAAIMVSIDALSEIEQNNRQHMEAFFGQINSQVAQVNAAMAECGFDTNNPSKITDDGQFDLPYVEVAQSDSIAEFKHLDESEKQAMLGRTARLKNKDWQGYLDDMETYSDNWQDNGTQQMALSQLLGEDAPFEFIEPFLTDGVVLSPTTIFALVANNNRVRIAKLIPYGLQLTAVNEHNQTPLQYAKAIAAPKDLIELLINKTATND